MSCTVTPGRVWRRGEWKRSRRRRKEKKRVERGGMRMMCVCVLLGSRGRGIMMASFATARTDSYASSSKDFFAATARLKKTRMKRKWVLALFFIFFPPSFLELCALLLPIYRGEHWDAGGAGTTRIYYFISSWGKRYDGRWERCVTWSFIIKKRGWHGSRGEWEAPA